MVDAQVDGQIQLLTAEHQALADQVQQLADRLTKQFGGPISRQEIRAGVEAHKVLTALAGILGVPPDSDDLTWRQGLDRFVKERLQGEIEADTSRIIEGWREEAGRLEGSVSGLTGRLKELEEKVGAHESALDARLAQFRQKAEDAEAALGAAQKDLLRLWRLVDDLSAAAAELCEKAPAGGA